jgi:hypothetical protein
LKELVILNVEVRKYLKGEVVESAGDLFYVTTKEKNCIRSDEISTQSKIFIKFHMLPSSENFRSGWLTTDVIKGIPSWGKA